MEDKDARTVRARMCVCVLCVCVCACGCVVGHKRHDEKKRKINRKTQEQKANAQLRATVVRKGAGENASENRANSAWSAQLGTLGTDGSGGTGVTPIALKLCCDSSREARVEDVRASAVISV